MFGLALDAFFDEVTVATRKENTNSGTITITDEADRAEGERVKDAGRTPTDPDANTAGLVARAVMGKHGITDDLDITIAKGVPMGLGLGSSAASAAASAVALDRLYGLNLTRDELVMAAGRGEEASAGTVHYDNVAASIAGGFVMVRPGDPVTVARFKPAADLRFCVAIPAMAVPDRKTEVSRGALPERITLKDSTQNLANASLLAVALATGDSSMLGSGITEDVIAEPARRHMIPGFDHIKRAALGAGAKEVMISGAGPSVIAVTTAGGAVRRRIAGAMAGGFRAAGTECRTVICKPAGGARAVPVGGGRAAAG